MNTEWLKLIPEDTLRVVVRAYLEKNRLHLARYVDDRWNEDYFPEVFGDKIWTDGTWIP